MDAQKVIVSKDEGRDQEQPRSSTRTSTGRRATATRSGRTTAATIPTATFRSFATLAGPVADQRPGPRPRGKGRLVATAVRTGAEQVEWDLERPLPPGRTTRDSPAISTRRRPLATSTAVRRPRRRAAAAELADATAELERIVSAVRNVTLFARLRFDADTADEARAPVPREDGGGVTALENDLRFFEQMGGARGRARPRRCSKRRSSNSLPTSCVLSAASDRITHGGRGADQRREVDQRQHRVGPPLLRPACPDPRTTTARTCRSTRRATGCASPRSARSGGA